LPHPKSFEYEQVLLRLGVEWMHKYTPPSSNYMRYPKIL
jgi:hypothetical protein